MHYQHEGLLVCTYSSSFSSLLFLPPFFACRNVSRTEHLVSAWCLFAMAGSYFTCQPLQILSRPWKLTPVFSRIWKLKLWGGNCFSTFTLTVTVRTELSGWIREFAIFLKWYHPVTALRIKVKVKKKKMLCGKWRLVLLLFDRRVGQCRPKNNITDYSISIMIYDLNSSLFPPLRNVL